MNLTFNNPPKSPFKKGGLISVYFINRGCGNIPPFSKGGLGGIIEGGHLANNNWGKPL
jgi:hypothetical protein